MAKNDRPYTLTIVTLNNLTFAIPLRSDISHQQNVLWTNKAAKCGLDFTKAILILDPEYIDPQMVFIRQNEHKNLLGKERRVKEKMEKCIADYKKAKADLSKEHNREYCAYSSLQYFEQYLYPSLNEEQ